MALLLAWLAWGGTFAQAQVQGISGATVTYQTYTDTNDNYSTTGGGSAGFPTGTVYNIRFNEGVSNQMFLGDVTVGGRTFDGIALAGQINIARTTNATIKGEHHIVLYQQSSYSGTNIFLKSRYAPTMEESLRSPLINHGADNVFSDQGDGNGNNNNIQRIDYLFPDGLPVHSHVEQRGFLVMDRGGNDRFKIAAITALDGNGKPAAFSPPVSVLETQWGASGVSLDTVVMRGYTNEGDPQHPSADVDPQPLSGVFLNWQTLGLRTNDLFYGYALAANDTTTNGAYWTLVNNAVYFPTNTSPESTFGGLDLISGGLMFYDEALNVTLGDRAWDDLDADGIQEAGEPGISNVLVHVYDSSTNLAAVVRTDTNGVWKSPGHGPGSYFAKYFLPTHYEFTGRYAGTNTAIDSDADLVAGRTATFAMTNGQTNLTLDAGMFRRAAIGDWTWEDANGNGQQDGGEPALSNVVVRLYNAASNVVGTTTSSVAGAYAFTDLLPGAYFVDFTPPAGYFFTTPNAGADATDSDPLPGTNRTALITLVSGQAETTADAGFYRPASLGDFTWEDRDADGQQDGGEPALASVGVRLYNATSNLLATTTSSVAGAYAFTNLAPGSYFVGFALPAGYLFTASNVGADATDSDPLPGTNRTALIALVSGQADAAVDAGFVRPASLGDFTWVDANGNGQQDGGEPARSNVVVRLYDATSNVVGTTTSSVAGAYAFTNLFPGSYFVGFTRPSGYVFTFADTGADATDSDADAVTGFTALVALTNGQTDATVDAGFVQPAAIGNYAWVDGNFNGQQDGGEPALANVVVRLYDAASNVVGTTTSSVAGIYAFTNLSAGVYFVGFTPPAGWSFTTANAGADATDSDADPATGFTPPVVLSGGQVDQTVDAGFYNPASVSLKLFKSTGLSGNWDFGATNDYYLTLQNTGTVALAGVALTDALPPGVSFVDGSAAIVQLLATTTNPFVETVSDGFGTVSYANNDGTANWVGGWNEQGDNASAASGSVLVRTTGGTNALVFELTNADNDHVTRTNALAAAAGRVYTNVTLSFSYRRENWDSGDSFTFYVSTNGFAGQSNLVFAVPTTAGTDAGYVHVQISTNLTSGMGTDLALRLRAGGSFDYGDRINVDFVMIAHSGYDVALNPAMTYAPGVTVNVVSNLASATPANLLSNYTLPAGSSVTVRIRATLGAPLVSTQLVNTATATNPVTPPLTASVTNVSVANAVGDRAWVDANANGVQDGGEGGVTGVTVRIYSAASNLLATTTTDSAGAYSFTNLPTGAYLLEFAAAGYIATAQDQGGDDAQDSDIDAAGRTVAFTLSGGTNDTGWDAGGYLLASLGDFTWIDGDFNGQQDGGEPGLSNVVVTLYNAVSNVMGVTTSSAAGAYAFNNLVPGSYFLAFAPPSGYLFTTSNVGADATDSDALAGTNRTALVTLVSGQNDLTVDAGFYRPASLGDYTWVDGNYNGQQDGGEPALSNVVVTLFNAASNAIGMTTSSVTGAYAFTNLPSGSYFLGFAPPSGYRFTTSNVGADATDSDALAGTNRTALIALIAGQADVTVDAGFYRPASLGDFTWVDRNFNGQQDGGEPGLANVVVTLYNAASNVLGVTTSSAGGAYAFTNLVPGSYSASFMPPAGYLFTTANVGADATDSDATAATGVTGNITLTSGQADVTVDAGFYQVASLGDFTWEDANGNGQQDGGEPGLSGVVVTLYNAASNAIGTATSSVAGSYEFANLVPGTYFVGFAPPSGCLFTTSDAGADVTDSDPLPGTSRTAPVALVSGQADATVDAGFYRTASFGDFTWVDTNGNGQQDGGESGLSNVVVTLYNAASNVLGATTSSVTGAYAFENLAPGSYFMAFAPPAGYLFTTANAGADATDSDPLPGTNRTALVVLASGQAETTVDAGFVQPASIGNYTWVDGNFNGQQDGGELALSNVVVRLYGAASNMVGTTTSSVAGAYVFTNLSAGVYFVGFTAPAGYAFTMANAGADATDSDADPATGFTATVALSGGQADATVDAGFYNPASVSLKLFKSSGLSGNWDFGATNDYYLTLQNTGTVALAGVALTDALPPGVSFVDGSAAIVQLLATATNPFVETVSDGFGTASYANNDGTANWVGGWNEQGDNAAAASGSVLVRTAGGTNALVFELTNADNDHVTRTNALVAVAGRVYTNVTLSFSYRRENWDSGDSFTFYVSTNGFAGQSNRVFAVPTTAGTDAGYVRISTNLTSRMGADLALRLRAGGSFGAGDRINIDSITFTNSGYAVSSVPVAVYQDGVTVNVVSNLAGATPASLLSNYAVPAGSSVTVRIRATLDVPLVATQFVNTAAATNPATPPLTASVTNVAVANSVGDRTWFDADGDGIQDGGEPGLTGVTVRIYAAGSNWVATTTSGVAGAYGFTGLPSGTYFLEFDAPTDHLPALQDQGVNDALDSDSDPATGRTAAFALSGGMSDTTRDAGFYQPPASIGDFVWREVNIDGLQSGGSETGMPGVAVRLYDAATNLVATTNTTAAGFYSFLNLPPATYFLEFTAAPGFMFTLQNQGGDDAVDSDVSRTSGRTAPFFLPVGSNDTRWDAGLVEIASGLHLTKTSDAGSCLSPGDAITYTLTVVNTGNVTQTGVAVEDFLPAGLTYVPDSAQVVVSNAATRTVRDEFNAVAYSGQDGTENWSVDWQEDDPSGTAGPVGNYVGVANGRMTLHYLYVGDEAAWRWADLSAETNATLSFDWETAGLDANEYLDVQVAASPAGPFTQLEQFGGTVSGSASYDITAHLSTSTTIRIEATPGTENWESGEYAYLDNIEMASTWTSVATQSAFAPPQLLSGQTLMPGGSLTVTFQATVDAPSLVTQLVNTASVSSPMQPTLQASTTNCVVFADVGVWKAVSDATPDMLETIQYILVASNNGPATATGVVITDVLPPQVQYVGHSNGVYSAVSGVWTLGTLAVNASTSLHVNVTVREDTADLDVTNTATVTGRDLFDPVAGNDSSSVVIVPKGWAAVGDRAWLDADANGIQDVGETGLAGVTVRIYGAGSNLLAEATTGTDGWYSFTNLPSGSYFLEFAAPLDHFAAPQDQGGDDALDSDIAAGTGRTAIFSLGGGMNDASWDAGFYLLASIGDRTWEDANWNGLQDGGESEFSNVVVRLYNAASNVVGTTTSSASGAYAFTGLLPGSYFVGFTPPVGYQLTPANAGDDATDSDPLADTGFTGLVTLTGGQEDPTVDAGFFQIVSVGDRVWFDANRDGIQNSGETNGFANVPVALLNTNGVVVAETITDLDGYYLFAEQPAGTYVVRFDLSGISTNEVVTDSKTGGDDEVDSDAISGMTGDYAWTGAFSVGGRVPMGEEETLLAVDLGVSTKDSTRAEVAEVWGEWTEGGGHVAWRTGSEFGTAGFFVYRIDPETGEETRLSDILVPSAFNEAGSLYGRVDPEVREGGEGTYRLEEIELSGEVRDLGIHAVRFSVPAPSAKTVRPKAVSAKAGLPAPRTAPAPAGPSSVLKVLVKNEGLHGVGLTAIAAGMGLAPEEVRTLAETGALKITEQSRPVPVLFDAARDRLVFHARLPARDWYVHDAVYLISAGEGLAMPRREPGASSGGTAFPVRLRFEEDRFLFSMTQMPEDFYFWAGVVSQTNDLLAPRFPLDLTGFAGDDLTLKVRLMGWSSTTNDPDHLAEISFNGAVVGAITFDDQETAEAELTIPGAAVANGLNTVMVNGVMKPGQSHSFFVVDWIEAAFDRELTPLAPVASFRADGAAAVSAQAFAAPLALALDEAGNPTWIADANGELPGKAWAVAVGDARFALVESAAVPLLVPEPAAADAWFLSETNRIDYLVIASRELAPAAQELADYRAGQGLRVGVAMFEDLCDLMTGGLRTPQAIPALLRHASATWAQPPKMVVLAGGGHYDYLGATFGEVNPLPPLLIQTPDGVCASDGLLADIGGDDLPDVAIGRLPALTAADLAAMIAKIKVYEAGFGAEWQNQLVLVADQGNSAGDFSDSNAKLAEWVAAPYSVARRIDLDAMAIGPARANLMDAFHAGAGFIHYTGHGGLFNLSGKGLLTAADVAQMDNAARPPITVALSCLLGRYELPATDSLGELLMRRPQGGAVALLAPSGLSFNAPATELGEAFYRAVLQDGVGTLGLAFLRARRSLRNDRFTRDTFAVYNLLGDPALRIAGNEMTNGAPASAEIFLQDLEQGYDGQPRAATARTEPAGLAVRFTYDGSASAPTEAGSYAVIGVVADDTFVGSATGTLVVAKAEAAISLGALAPVYDGSPKNATAMTVPAGLPVEFRYDGGRTAPTEAGSYAVVATVVDGNHQASTSGTLVVAKASAAVALGGLEQTYDGTSKRVAATTDPAGLAVAITYGGGDAPPVPAGRYAVAAEIDDPNFDGSAVGTLVVAKAAQTIDFPAIEDPLAPDGVGLSAISSSGLPVSFAVVNGPARISEGAHLSFTGAGAVSVMASQAGDGNWEPAPDVVRTFHVSPIMLSATDVNAREDGEGRFYVRLAYAPAAATAVTVARSGGDAVLAVKSGANLTFSSANWDVWQAVTLAAAADANGDNETAVFRISAPGMADQFVEATALDVDIGPNLALASNGSRITGTQATKPEWLIDGVHGSSANYGYTIWTNQTSPGTMTLDLQDAMLVSRIRLLNWDWGYRSHQYRIESSLDGTTWSPLVDAGEGEHRGWEDWALEDMSIRYLRFTGLSNSANRYVCVAEWEVHGPSAQFQSPRPEISSAAVNVREAGEGRFHVRLDRAPEANVAVAVVRAAGDAGLSVESGAALTFTPANWAAWQVVTLAAAEDENGDNETATFRISAPGVADRVVKATALDIDIGENRALASLGSAITGTQAYSPDRAIDGVHASSVNYGYPIWTNPASPGTMTLDLKVATAVSRIRLLNWDWGYRSHQYRIESSLDGTSWAPLVDASAGEHRGWEDWAVADRTVRYLRFTALSNSVNRFVCIAEWEVYALPVEPRQIECLASAVHVREGGEGRFHMRLDSAPAGSLSVGVSRSAGDPNLFVKSGANLTFTPANWSAWQAVTLAANADANGENETAIFRIAVPGGADRFVEATTLDDDIGVNWALASNGSTISGTKATKPEWLIDGVHASRANYGYTTWTNRSSPGTMTLDLKAATSVSRIRLLNWDWSYRAHQYRIDSSLDGETWSPLVDASAGEHRGWEDWPLAGPSARYLRFTGLSNSVNAFVCLAEWEVYGERTPEKTRHAFAKAEPPAPPLIESMDIESIPMTVVTSDDGPEHTNGWAAVDGDPNTLWAGEPGAGGWHIAVGYDSPLRMTNLVVDVAEGSPADIQCLYSLDAKEWRPLPDDLARNPVELNYLWLLFPADDLTASEPRVIEIRPQQ